MFLLTDMNSHAANEKHCVRRSLTTDTHTHTQACSRLGKRVKLYVTAKKGKKKERKRFLRLRFDA